MGLFYIFTTLQPPWVGGVFCPHGQTHSRVLTPRQWNTHQHKYCIIKSHYVQSKNLRYPGLKFPSIRPRAKFYFAWVIFGGVAGSTRRGGGIIKSHYFYDPHPRSRRSLGVGGSPFGYSSAGGELYSLE